MSRHHANSQNPKIIRMQEDFRKRIDEFSNENPYLAGIIDANRNTRHMGDRRFGYAEATEMIDLLRETGLSKTLNSEKDIQNPAAFWELMDCAKKHQTRTGDNRAIKAVNFLYEKLDKSNVLKEEFKNGEKTPYPFLRRVSFLKKLSSEYTNSEDTYILNYQNGRLPLMINIPYRNKFLRSLVVESFIRDQSRYTVTQKETKELCTMEKVFGPYADKINCVEDLNAEVLTYAKNYIMEKYADDERIRIKYMKHLWCIFRYAVINNPETKFFEGSHLWNALLIMNHRVPIQIAQGFVPVLIESSGSIPAYEKVLYIYNNGEFFGANGISYGMFAADFSKIKTELYRWLAINFIATTDQRKHTIVGQFLIWLENSKAKPISKYKRIDWIYADELCTYKHEIGLKTRNGCSRNAYIQGVVNFVRWAAGTERIHVQKGVFKYFDNYKHRYEPHPRSLTTCRARTIEKTLLEMAEKDPRFLLTVKLFKIILHSDIRAGQLCSIDLDRMIWNKDGTSSYISRTKNRGGGMVRNDFSKYCTTLIKEAAELTEEIRNECPVEGPKTCLFLYRGIRRFDDEISVMNLQRINKDLKAACIKAGIETVTTGNIRDTRQTAVAKFAHKHNLNDAQIATLTKHTRKTSLNSYIDLHVEDLIVATEDITLGTLKHKENA